MSAIRGDAALVWTDADDATTERVLFLREPLRDLRPAHLRTVFAADSLDFSQRQVFAIAGGADELMTRVRFGDDPQGLLDLCAAGSKGRTITYLPSRRDPGRSFACLLTGPLAPLALGLDPDRGTTFGDVDVELHFRLPTAGMFRQDVWARDLLFRYRAGGPLRNATVTRASTATYLDNTGTLQAAAVNRVRTEWLDLDSDGVREQPTLYLTGSRTNLQWPSEDVSHANWTKTNVTISANATTAPDGLLTADKLVETTGNGEHGVFRTVALGAAGNRSASLVFAKAAERSVIELLSFGVPSGNAFGTRFNLATGLDAGTITGGGILTGKASLRLRDGWYALLIMGTTHAGDASQQVDVRIVNDTGNTGYVGDVTKGLYVWGLQTEDAAFPSSYIPTTIAPVTRNADLVTVPFGFGPQSVTVLVRVARPLHADVTGTLGLAPGLLQLGYNTAPDCRLWFNSAERTVTASIRNGVGQESQIAANIPAGNPLTIACQFRNLRTAPQARLDVGSGYGNPSPAITGFPAFGSQVLQLGGQGSDSLHGHLLDVLVMTGDRTKAEMEARL